MPLDFHYERRGMGFEDLVEHVNVTKKSQQALTVGVHKEESVRAREGESNDSATVQRALTNVEIAQIHELGLGVPKRPFLHGTFFANRAKYKKLSAETLRKFVHGDELSRGLLRMGQVMVSDVQRAIIKGVPPALATGTVKSKKRRGLPRAAVALYATGALFNAIKAKLVGKGGG